MLSSSHVCVFYSKRRWRTNSSLVHESWRFWRQRRLIVCFYPKNFEPWYQVLHLPRYWCFWGWNSLQSTYGEWVLHKTFGHTSILLQLSCSILRSVLRSILLSVLLFVLLHLQFMIRYCYSVCMLQLAPYYAHTTTAVWECFYWRLL